MKVTPFNVMPRLPKPLEPLREIAFNIWFSWNWEAVQLFIRLSDEYWDKTYQNPTLMLGVIPQERFEEVMQDESFMANLKRVHSSLKNYISAKTWFAKTHPDATRRPIAYFSTEYGIDVGIPIYSGGLGVLAGDHLKSASDLGLPLVAVGLLYREGYLSQYLTVDGWQQEKYPSNDWYNMPVVLVTDPDGKPVIGDIDLAGEKVAFQIWKILVGRIPLYLLDTDLPQNPSQHRAITTRLYAGERDMRLRQEILLGIGGMKALEAMGIEPYVCHMNEGHSAFLALERMRQVMNRYKLTRAQAWEIVWAGTVFTTHTPVPAGNERFHPDLVKHYLEHYLGEVGISWEEFLALGRENPNNPAEEFCLTVFALHHAAHCNGVSKLHGATSRKLWKSLWPNVPTDEVPIKHVTNGIHTRSWLSHDMAALLESYMGPRFVEEPMDFDVWENVSKVPDAELWRTHERRRERLVWFARKRLREQRLRRGAPPYLVAEADEALDPRALTIGFARRFASYKRATLILHDQKRIENIINNPDRPVQIIFAGKAHPMDTAGKELMKSLIQLIRKDAFRNRIVFLEDYDINVARYMVQGADIWHESHRQRRASPQHVRRLVVRGLQPGGRLGHRPRRGIRRSRGSRPHRKRNPLRHPRTRRHPHVLRPRQQRPPAPMDSKSQTIHATTRRLLQHQPHGGRLYPRLLSQRRRKIRSPRQEERGQSALACRMARARPGKLERHPRRKHRVERGRNTQRRSTARGHRQGPARQPHPARCRRATLPRPAR